MHKYLLIFLIVSSCASRIEKSEIIKNRKIADDAKKTIFIEEFNRNESYGSTSYPSLDSLNYALGQRNYYQPYYNSSYNQPMVVSDGVNRDSIDMKKELAQNLEETGCFKVVENLWEANYMIKGSVYAYPYDEPISVANFFEMLTLLPLFNILPTRESFSAKAYVSIYDKNDNFSKEEEIKFEPYQEYNWLMRHSFFKTMSNIGYEKYKKKERDIIAAIQDIAAAKLAENLAGKVCGYLKREDIEKFSHK